MRAWRDIQPATAFLTTRVRSPDEDDWGKVKRVLSYLKGTLHMPLILSADLLTLSRWWVDAAYPVHDDCRGHTGAGMSFGQGMALRYSWKHKINTKSSTARPAAKVRFAVDEEVREPTAEPTKLDAAATSSNQIWE